MLDEKDNPSALQVLERVTDGFVALDRSFRVVFMNSAAEAAVRKRRDELVGRILWEAYPDVIGTDIERNYRRAMAEQVVVEFETYYPPLEIWADVHAYPSSSGLSIFFQDITARKRAERALRESEERYRRIVETAHEGIWLVDEQYQTTWVNARAAQMFGRSLDEMKKLRVADLVVEEDLPLLREQMAARREGHAAQYDIRMKGASGRVMWVLARITPILDDDGTFRGALGMLTDITERKLAEQQLEHQREWLRVTLASIGDAVIATDPQGRITFMNAVAEDLTAWSEKDAIGHPLREVFRIVNEETRAPVEDPVAKVLRENRVVGLANHTSLIARDGTERPIDDSGAPIRDDSGAIIGVVLVFRDNTERARAEKSLRDADRRKDEFLAMLAHELRNPLAPIRSALELMKLRNADASSLERARAIVERQVQHMTRLVDDLLDVARITRGKINLQKEWVDLGVVVARAVETVAPLVEQRQQKLEVSLPPTPVRVEVDPTRLAQVLGNLLHNATKFTADRGHITVEAETSGKQLVIRVRDEGAGITPDALPRLFEPFTQLNPSLDRAQGGLGLGLTLVKNLVEMHGGTVAAKSGGLGKGAEFSVTLPLAESSAATAGPAERSLSSSGSLRVFVVDDNVDAADMLALLLSHLGHAPTVAHDAASALERIPVERPDVVLLDIGLPGMTGYEVARRLRADQRVGGVKLLALSGYGQAEDQRRSRDAGFDGHLVKPVAIETLQSLLAQLAGPRAASG